MVLILFVQVLKKVLKSLKFELKNPAETLVCVRGGTMGSRDRLSHMSPASLKTAFRTTLEAEQA